MVGILLVSHGKMAEGIKDSMQLIVGELENIDTASLLAGQDFEELRKEVMTKIEKLDRGSGVIVYVDLYGASPYNAAMLAYPELQIKGIDIRVITGMNLPMILEVALMRDQLTLNEIQEISINSGKTGILEGISSVENSEEIEEDGDY